MNRGFMTVVCALSVLTLLGACKTASQGPEAAPPSSAAPAAQAPVDLKGPYLPDAEGYIRHWLFAGPFPNPGGRPQGEENAQAACKGFNADLLNGEAGYVPRAGAEVAVQGGKKVIWKAIVADGDTVDMASLLDSTDDTVIYAACWVELEKEVEAEIRVGSDDGNKIWLDHKLVATVHEHRAQSPDQDVHKVKLTAGKHLLLVKVDNDWGGFSFCLRIVTPDGKKIPGLKIWN